MLTIFLVDEPLIYALQIRQRDLLRRCGDWESEVLEIPTPVPDPHWGPTISEIMGQKQRDANGAYDFEPVALPEDYISGLGASEGWDQRSSVPQGLHTEYWGDDDKEYSDEHGYGGYNDEGYDYEDYEDYDYVDYDYEFHGVIQDDVDLPYEAYQHPLDDHSDYEYFYDNVLEEDNEGCAPLDANHADDTSEAQAKDLATYSHAVHAATSSNYAALLPSSTPTDDRRQEFDESGRHTKRARHR